MERLKPLLMIVDDDVPNLKALENIFKDDYRIVPRKSGEQVLKYFEMFGFFQGMSADDSTAKSDEESSRKRTANTPDLILLDVMMPGLDGYAVCAMLKEDPDLTKIPVIFVTGRIEAKDVTRGFETGAVDYVTKPFNTAELQARVATHLSLKKARENLTEKNVLLEQKMQELAEQTEKLRQKDAQLLMMDRIAGIGTLAAGIAHEINNPLGFLKSSASGLRADYGKMAEAITLFWEQQSASKTIREDSVGDIAVLDLARLLEGIERKFARIDRGIERIGTIVNSLRRFSRIDREEEGALDINASIEDAVGLLSSAEKPIRFKKNLAPVPSLKCIPNEINQCLLHLLKNAVDAVGNDGIIIIQTAYDQDKQRLSVRISDNGPGMTEEVRRQAFNPFFTTKPVGSGTGVGLTITELIVTKHQGHIELMSKEGEGTTVFLSLPISSG